MQSLSSFIPLIGRRYKRCQYGVGDVDVREGPFPRLIQPIWKDTTLFEDAEQRPVMSPIILLPSLSLRVIYIRTDLHQRLSHDTLLSMRGRIALEVLLPISERALCYTPNLEGLVILNCGAFLLPRFVDPSLRHLRISGDRLLGWDRSYFRLVYPASGQWAIIVVSVHHSC